jgi:hypothetical protein
MSKFYKVSGIEGFNGLVLETGDDDIMTPIINILNPHQIVGDRILKIPMPEQVLFINATKSHFVATDDPQKEFTTANPFGQHLFEGAYRKGNLQVVYSRYDNGISITVLEEFGNNQMRTLYTQNFFRNAPQALSQIEMVMSGDADPEDLIFELKALEAEAK